MTTRNPGRTRSLRTPLAVGAAAAAMIGSFAIGAPAADAGQTYWVPVDKTWTVNGHGYGHGHGMSQYGAQGAALQGLKYPAIAEFYYPGTKWSTVTGNVRVLISADTSSDLQVKPRPGLVVRDLTDQARWRLPERARIDIWRLMPVASGATEVQYHNGGGWHTWTTPDGRTSFKSDGQFEGTAAITLLVPSGSSTVAKIYRGVLRLVRPFPGATARDTVNVLTMDQYVQGVVPYEMPASWAQQALRAQAVAARTYAAYERALNPRRYYQICDTTACQVYGGVSAEQPTTNKAVQGTAGRILTYNGKAAFTQFSSSSGGWTSDGGQPYLPAKADPYDDWSGNGVHNWSTTVSTTALESAHPEIGDLVDMRVTTREGNGAWGGRALQIVLDGTEGRAYLTGDDFRWQYGLRSSWFTIEPTPIIQRWRQLGGVKSGLGAPKSGEYAVDSGAAQDFKLGRIYWSAKTGAQDIKGKILQKYRALGGPDSTLGWPTSGTVDGFGPGRKAHFQKGWIYTRPSTGAHAVYGPVMRHWVDAGGGASWLGYPATDVVEIDGGQRVRFEHGAVTWHRSTNTITVRHF